MEDKRSSQMNSKPSPSQSNSKPPPSQYRLIPTTHPLFSNSNTTINTTIMGQNTNNTISLKDTHNLTTRKRRTPPSSSSSSTIRIVSASYGPCDGRRLINGEITTEHTRIPYTRDVLPFLRVIVSQKRRQQAQLENRMQGHNGGCCGGGGEEDGGDVPSVIMEGKSMNVIFGDPCLGTTKLLRLSYYYRGELCKKAFAEHEVVAFRKTVTFQNHHQQTYHDHDGTSKLKVAKIGISTNVNNMGYTNYCHEGLDMSTNGQECCSPSVSPPPQKWTISYATTETTLPIILPFLLLHQRAQIQLVSQLWRRIVREWGVAQIVDVQHLSSSQNEKHLELPRSYLRGIISNSFRSLHSLYLNDYNELTKEDLHPAVPHLKKLRNLDITRCHCLDDETLVLLSQHVSCTLQVLYIKGLQRVTDVGIVAIATTCTQLRVLELSHVRLTDAGAASIGYHLHKLEALYMKDNYKLTAASVTDVITMQCQKLTQLTLWGCVKLDNARFDNCENLLLLNLWGCFHLRDDLAEGMATLRRLRTLVVSECHRLTDRFVVDVARYLPQLQHLHLRYVRKLTDVSVTAIAEGMDCLYSLDLSFCTKITTASLIYLLRLRDKTLSELKLFSCWQLDSTGVLNLVRVLGDTSLSVLDLRACDKENHRGGNREDRIFNHEALRRLRALKFEQKTEGFFVRSVKWPIEVKERWAEELRWDLEGEPSLV